MEMGVDEVGIDEYEVDQMTSAPEEQRQMRQWQAVLDSAGEGIWGLDLEGRCTFANRLWGATFMSWYTIIMRMDVLSPRKNVRFTM